MTLSTRLTRPLGRMLCASILLGIASATASPLLAADPSGKPPEPQLMFVQVSQSMSSDPASQTVRLINVSPQTVYFADRPVRLAGHLKMAAYLDEWTKHAGKDNFAKDPPNATLSVYEPGKEDSTLAVIELLNPRAEGQDLVYNYRVIEGNPPKSGGETTLFIDSIGIGGGVGVGFHGVGVGRRGPGVR